MLAPALACRRGKDEQKCAHFLHACNQYRRSERREHSRLSDLKTGDAVSRSRKHRRTASAIEDTLAAIRKEPPMTNNPLEPLGIIRGRRSRKKSLTYRPLYKCVGEIATYQVLVLIMVLVVVVW